jgi:hypothetical protein
VYVAQLHFTQTLTAKIAGELGVNGHMKNFVIFVQGEPYLFEVDGKVQKAGFFATRRAEAKTESEAAQVVIQQLKIEPELRADSALITGVVPELEVKVAHEMPMEHKNTYSGFTYYPIEE